MNFSIAYILPNLITAASIFTGVLSIIYSTQDKFDQAVYMIILSAILDGLDGKVARLTGSTSRFGLEFDSLADTVAFGVAPAMLLFCFVGFGYGKIGVLVAALFVIFGAIRLARFNVIDFEPSVFIGLPIPAAALFMTSWSSLFHQYDWQQYGYYLLIMSLVISILMVSNVRYPSFKKNFLGKQHLLKILVILIIVLTLIYLYTIETILVIMTVYVLWGILTLLYHLIFRKVIKR